jgi:hypothetical protein
MGPRIRAGTYLRPPLPSGRLKVVAGLASFVLALVLAQVVAQLYAPLSLQNPF